MGSLCPGCESQPSELSASWAGELVGQQMSDLWENGLAGTKIFLHLQGPLDRTQSGQDGFVNYVTTRWFQRKEHICSNYISLKRDERGGFPARLRILLPLQNGDVNHKGGFCLIIRTFRSIVTCKFSLLRVTLPM